MNDEQRNYQEIMSRMPELMYLKHQFNKYWIQVSEVVLPARLKPKEPGESRMMGLPVTWVDEEKWGFAMYLKEPKKD